MAMVRPCANSVIFTGEVSVKVSMTPAGALLGHRFFDEQADAFGEAGGAFRTEQLRDVVQEFRLVLVGHFGFELDVLVTQ